MAMRKMRDKGVAQVADHNRTEEAQAVFMEKAKPKGDIRFNIQLNQEQKEGKAVIMDSEITVISSSAGTGKSLLVAATCLDLLFKKEIDSITITRPIVELGRSLGYLPGSESEKLSVYIEPFIDNLYQCYDKTKIDSLLKEGTIKGSALNFIRGKTFSKGQVFIVDEAQNTTRHEMVAIMARLGRGGKLIIVGDTSQKDTNESFDGLSYAVELAKNIEGISLIKLHSNHRSDLVGKILDYHYNKV